MLNIDGIRKQKNIVLITYSECWHVQFKCSKCMSAYALNQVDNFSATKGCKRGHKLIEIRQTLVLVSTSHSKFIL
jgi:hypothetical protein